MSLSEYQKCDEDFVLHATEYAKDELSTGANNASDQNYNLAIVLGEQPIFDSIGLIVQAVSDRFNERRLLPNVSSTVNLSEWNTGAESFLSLADKYPDLARQTPIGLVDRLIWVGEELDTPCSVLLDLERFTPRRLEAPV